MFSNLILTVLFSNSRFLLAAASWLRTPDVWSTENIRLCCDRLNVRAYVCVGEGEGGSGVCVKCCFDGKCEEREVSKKDGKRVD